MYNECYAVRKLAVIVQIVHAKEMFNVRIQTALVLAQHIKRSLRLARPLQDDARAKLHRQVLLSMLLCQLLRLVHYVFAPLTVCQ